MWLKDTIHYEQLDITYQNRLIIQLQGIKGTNNNYQLPFTTIWSTSRQANDLYGSDSLKPMIVKSYTKDYNYDTKMDELHIIGTLPLQNDEVITSATVLAFMDAELTVGNSMNNLIRKKEVFFLISSRTLFTHKIKGRREYIFPGR